MNDQELNMMENLKEGIGYSSDKILASFFGCTRKTIWSWANERENFPKPIKLGANTTRWQNSEVKQFIDGL